MVERSAFPWPYGDGRKTPETLAQEAALGRLRLDPLLTRWPEPHWRSFASALLRTGGDVDAACHAAGIRPDGMGRYAVLLKFSLDLDFQAECDRIHRLNQIPPTTVGLMAYALGLGCTFEEVAEDVGLPVEDVMGRVGCRRQDDRLPAHFPRVGPILQAEEGPEDCPSPECCGDAASAGLAAGPGVLAGSVGLVVAGASASAPHDTTPAGRRR